LLLWAGIALWLLLAPDMRLWLRRPAAWIGALLGFSVFLPVMLWEAAHQWPSFIRQGTRVGVWHPARAVDYLAELIAGQVGLVTPVVFIFCAAGVTKVIREAWRSLDPVPTLLVALTLPSVALFTQHAFGDRVQGNWPAIIYPGAAIAACTLRGPRWQQLWTPGIVLAFAITGLVYLQGELWLLPTPTGLDPLARELAGWDELAAETDAARRSQDAEYIAADQYGIVAELAFTLPKGTTLVGIGSRWPLLALPKASLDGKVGILVRTPGGGPGDMSWVNRTKIGVAKRPLRPGSMEELILYRVVGRAKADDAVLLPRPR
jgi:hypothetical protein